MSFALLHATLGWLLAALAALVLRQRSADARCWAWRLGLLKGPLALLLAVPVLVHLPFPQWLVRGEGPRVGTPMPATEAGPPRPGEQTSTKADAAGDIPFVAEGGEAMPLPPGEPIVKTKTAVSPAPFLRPTHLPPDSPSPPPPLPLSVAYPMGLLATLALRLAPRRVRREMPRVEGVFRPRVVIPDGLDPAEAAMARAHEEAHVRRRDPL